MTHVLKSAALAASISAFALGLICPSRAADVFPVTPPLSAFSWTGPYIGVNVGGGVADVSTTATAFGGSLTASETLTGIIGGGQVGFNWQTGPAVLGAEIDLQGSDQNNSITIGALSATDQITYFGTLRGRVGFAFDRWLPYFTAGGGYGGWSTNVSAAGFGTVFSATSSHAFFTVGGGLDVAIWGGLSGRIEYLFLDTGSITDNVATSLGTVTLNSTVHDNIVRVGANYRF